MIFKIKNKLNDILQFMQIQSRIKYNEKYAKNSTEDINFGNNLFHGSGKCLLNISELSKE
jgi:hypothetical protein